LIVEHERGGVTLFDGGGHRRLDHEGERVVTGADEVDAREAPIVPPESGIPPAAMGEAGTLAPVFNSLA
jgi:hypothetical protein